MGPTSEPAGTPVQPIRLLNQIMTGLRYRYASLNTFHYEAAWTDSWVHCRCHHKHLTLIDAARCGMPQPGFYVLAVDGGSTRGLTTEEDEAVNRFRFAGPAQPRPSSGANPT